MTEQPYIELCVSPLARLFTSIVTIGVGDESIEVPVKLEAYDAKLATVDDMVAAFMDPEAIRLSGLVGHELSRAHGAETDCAVYVIAKPGAPASKIGRAVSPIARLGGIQTAHWDEVKLFATCWAPTKIAYGLESLSLRLAAKVGRKLKGEWVEGSPEDVTYLIAAAAHSVNAPIADGRMWLRNRRRIMLVRSEYSERSAKGKVGPTMRRALHGDQLALKHVTMGHRYAP